MQETKLKMQNTITENAAEVLNQFAVFAESFWDLSWQKKRLKPISQETSFIYNYRNHSVKDIEHCL